MKICNPSCVYFPQYPSEILNEYIDENGVKRRSSIFLCGYDSHRIINYEKCDNYLDVNFKRRSMLEE